MVVGFQSDVVLNNYNIFIFMFNLKKIDSKVYSENNLYGKFSILPIKKGDSLTIGNALRRVLLSNLPGIAIIAVKIKGHNNEFSTIPGVREDILEILLNLKQIIFTGRLEQKTIINLKIRGPKLVTAKNIVLPYNLQIINLAAYIATISKNILLNLDLQISSGVGYKPLNINVNENLSNFIDIDAIFMPVTKVNYYIENIYLEPISINEHLIFEVWTNGSILPEKALKKGSEILINLFSSFNSSLQLINTNYIQDLYSNLGIILKN